MKFALPESHVSLFTAAFLLLLGLFCHLPQTAQATIYGEDNLTDVLLTADPQIIAISKSVATQVRSSTVVIDGLFLSRNLEHSLVCADERFVRQPISGTCTAFLIGPRHMMTASHCFNGGNVCRDFRWVFDYVVENENQTGFIGKAQDVYSCKKVVAAAYKDQLDYAIFELDRDVVGRPFLTLDHKTQVAKHTKIYSIHSPRGLPLKHSVGFVRDNSGENHFTSAIDMMRGSSGAPILDATTHQVIGILAQGDVDYDLQTEPFCNRFKRCGEYECRGEDATRINRIPGISDYLQD